MTRVSHTLIASCALLAAAGCARCGGAEPYALVSMDDVERMLGQPDVVVIDANTARTFKTHHLPGAVYWRSAPLAQLLPTDKEKRVVFYCASPS